MTDISIFRSRLILISLTLAGCLNASWLIETNLAAPADALTQSLSPELLQQLEDALAERNSDLKSRLALVAKINDQLKDLPADQGNLTEIRFKVRFVEALINLRLNNLQLCESQVAQLKSDVDPRAYPELAFRCRSLQAAAILMEGRIGEAQKALEELLAADNSSIPSYLVDRARVNHAHTLEESGRSDEAIALYQLIMFKAMQEGNDAVSLQSGSHLMDMFIDNDDLDAARKAHAELQPIVKRNSKAIGAHAVQLQWWALQLKDGDIDGSIHGLDELIKNANLPPILLGGAHRLMAEALERKGAADQAFEQLAIAKEKLRSVPTGMTHCHILEARLLMQKNDYDGVMRILAEEEDARLTPVLKKKIYELKLESTLRQTGRQEEAIWVHELIKASEDHEKRFLKLLAKDFEKQLASVKSDLDEQHRQALDQAAVQSDRLKQYRVYLLSGLIITCGLCVGGLAVVHFRRRAEKAKLDEQLALNAKLESLVEAKTLEVKANLAAQAELSQALERKKRIETVGLLAGNVAHDINNLLQVITNANQTLADEASNDQLRRQALQTSNESLRHGAGIVGQILAYSRQKELSEKSICVGEYLENSRALFQSAIGATNILHIQDRSQASRIHVDTSLLTTTLLNLLNNAADAMPESGTITIEASQAHLAAGQNANLPVGDYLHLTVHDTGTGFLPDDLTRAFEPFFTTKPVGHGTGLGLSSAKAFVTRSRGDIQIDSQPGAGTRVHIWLPLYEATDIQHPRTPPSISSTLEGKRLLLVEDHTSLAKSMVILLKQLKLEVVWSLSGDDAVTLLQQDSQFDFVLSDIRMPGTLDGVQLARWISSTFPDMPVVLMSGYNDIQVEELGIPHLHKPFKLDELKAILCEFVASFNP